MSQKRGPAASMDPLRPWPWHFGCFPGSQLFLFPGNGHPTLRGCIPSLSHGICGSRCGTSPAIPLAPALFSIGKLRQPGMVTPLHGTGGFPWLSINPNAAGVAPVPIPSVLPGSGMRDQGLFPKEPLASRNGVRGFVLGLPRCHSGTLGSPKSRSGDPGALSRAGSGIDLINPGLSRRS